jgi:hypothetical protein
MAARRSLPIEQYQVGVVCPLPHEMTTAIAILDERHQRMAGQDYELVGQPFYYNAVLFFMARILAAGALRSYQSWTEIRSMRQPPGRSHRLSTI